MKKKLNAVVLAAGVGDRMKTTTPKILCEILGKPMICWVVDNLRDAGISDIAVVLKDENIEIKRLLGDDVYFTYQTMPLGTAHAAMQAENFLKERMDNDTLVLGASLPLLMGEQIREAYSEFVQTSSAATAISSIVDDNRGLSRILRNGGAFAAVADGGDLSNSAELIDEIYTGAGIFNTSALIETLPLISNDNLSEEYKICDIYAILARRGRTITSYCSPGIMPANNLKMLMMITEQAARSVIDKHLNSGVEFMSTSGVFISPDAKIGLFTRILPGTIIKGETIIGKNCVIGPYTVIKDCTIGNNTIINQSQARGSVIGSSVSVGPFSQIRPNCNIADNVKIGDFVELKNSAVDEGTKIPHLTYVGDSDVGKDVNFGCGTVTVNYDGTHKHRTIIKDGAFIGCNTNLIAPVTVGAGAYTAAGSTVTEEVPDGALAVARARQTVKSGWAVKKLRNEGGDQHH